MLFGRQQHEPLPEEAQSSARAIRFGDEVLLAPKGVLNGFVTGKYYHGLGESAHSSKLLVEDMVSGVAHPPVIRDCKFVFESKKRAARGVGTESIAHNEILTYGPSPIPTPSP